MKLKPEEKFRSGDFENKQFYFVCVLCPATSSVCAGGRNVVGSVSSCILARSQKNGEELWFVFNLNEESIQEAVSDLTLY